MHWQKHIITFCQEIFIDKLTDNKENKPTGTAIGEFEFLVLAIRFFKIDT